MLYDFSIQRLILRMIIMKSKEFIQGLIEYLKNNLNIPDANFLKV